MNKNCLEFNYTQSVKDEVKAFEINTDFSRHFNSNK